VAKGSPFPTRLILLMSKGRKYQGKILCSVDFVVISGEKLLVWLGIELRSQLGAFDHLAMVTLSTILKIP